MISRKINEAINAQINAEMWAAYLYLEMSLYADTKGLSGMSHWFRKQYEEEQLHAFRLIDYLSLQGASIELTGICDLPTTWNCPKCMFEEALEHEHNITVRIHSICYDALQEQDFATISQLKYFIDEQVEEEASVQNILYKLEHIGNDRAALFLLDQELLKRE